MTQHPNVWSKVTCPERLSVTGPPALNGEQDAYRDVAPFARRLVESFPDRVLTGTAQRDEHRFVGTPIAARLRVFRQLCRELGGDQPSPAPVTVLTAAADRGVTVLAC
jgi:hypothetical protein